MAAFSSLAVVGRSSTFRLTLFYSLLFSLSVLALFAFTYFQTVVLLDRQSADRLSEEIDDLASIYHAGGGTDLVRAIVERSDASRGTNTLYLLADASGRLLAGNLDGWPKATSTADGWIRFQVHDPLGGRGAKDTTTGTNAAGESGQSATAEAKTFNLPNGVRLLVGRNLGDLEAYRRRFESAATLVAVLTVLLGVGGGFLITRRVLARLDSINGISDRILAGELDRRVPVTDRGDEFDRLGSNLNAMLAEIEKLLASMRQVTDNIAHDLRTPLGRLRSRLELALLQPRQAGTDQDTLEESLTDIDNVLGTFNALLLIAQLEAGHRDRDFVPVDLAKLTQDAAELYAPTIEDSGQVLRLELPTSAPQVRGEPHLLFQLLTNLLDNALKFASGGEITLLLAPTAGGLTLTVGDRGPGIPPADRQRVFGRLVRLDNSRMKPGSGLGLSLVKAIAELHHGTVVLADNQPGLKVLVTLPAAGDGPDQPAGHQISSIAYLGADG